MKEEEKTKIEASFKSDVEIEVRIKEQSKIAMKMRIKTKEEALQSKEVASKIQQAIKQIDKRRLEKTKDAREYVDNINKYAGELKEPLLKAKAHLASQLLNWQREEARKEIEERKAREKATADSLLAGDKTEKSSPPKPKQEKIIATRKTLEYTIVDAKKIPREFLMPDDLKIRKALKAKIEIPGVNYWYKDVPIIRSN